MNTKDCSILIIALVTLVLMVFSVFEVLASWETQDTFKNLCKKYDSTPIIKSTGFTSNEKYCINKNNQLNEVVCYEKLCFFIETKKEVW